MKTLAIAFLVLFMVLASTLSGVLYGAETSDSAGDHLKLAALYRGVAVALEDSLILEHWKMKQDYPKKSILAASGKVQEMEKHCDVIISDATKLRNDLLGFAKWHRMRAAELQGQ